jgi:hypothetical protein
MTTTDTILDNSIAQFTKKVEILRALVRTEGGFKNEFPGLKSVPFAENGKIKEIDLRLMTEFKKIFSLGTSQLEKFVNLLNEHAPDPDTSANDSQKLDVYSVLYYKSLLERSPYAGTLGEIVGENDEEEGSGIECFKPAPDIMGVNATGPTVSNSSTPVFTGISQDISTDTLRKTPAFMVSLLTTGKSTTQGVFNSNIGSAVNVDNTLPMIDKQNEQRREDEGDPEKGRSKVTPAHGNLMVKDIEKIQIMKDAEEGILEEVEAYLEDKAFTIYVFNKLINYFNPTQNRAESVNDNVERTMFYMEQVFEKAKDQGDAGGCGAQPDMEKLEIEETKVSTDMFGQTFDSVERREFELRTSGANQTNEFKLYTVEGQLGSGIDIEEDPMDPC